jgi:hypothetical protein
VAIASLARDHVATHTTISPCVNAERPNVLESSNPGAPMALWQLSLHRLPVRWSRRVWPLRHPLSLCLEKLSTLSIQCTLRCHSSRKNYSITVSLNNRINPLTDPKSDERTPVYHAGSTLGNVPGTQKLFVPSPCLYLIGTTNSDLINIRS